MWALGFVGLGYGMNTLKDQQLKKVELQKDNLVKRRLLRLQKQELMENQGQETHH
jgi:hypothetical protein